MTTDQTLLTTEIGVMEAAGAAKLLNYRPPKGSPVDVLFRIFNKHSRDRISPHEEEKIRAAIEAAIQGAQTIPIGIVWSCGGIAPSPMKFREPKVNLPRLGDVWPLFWLNIFNQKVQTIHPPGIEVIIADETSIFEHLGVPPGEVRLRLTIMEEMARQYAPFITICSLPSLEELGVDPEVGEPTNDEILAIATALPSSEVPQEVFDQLYTTRVKDWNRICGIIPTEIWEQSRTVATHVRKLGAARRGMHFFAEKLGGRTCHIDAAITEKGRFCPKIWGEAFPQHGGTLLRANEHGKYSVRIVPEYRLLKHDCIPVMINSGDFNPFSPTPLDNQDFTFYWQHPSG